MITFEALDVILRVQNLPGFIARMRAGARSVGSIGAAAQRSNASVGSAVVGVTKKAGLSIAMMAAIAAGAGLKMSIEFQKQMTLIHTQAGASMNEVKMLGVQVKDLARTSVFGPVELAKGLYHLESIGFRGADAMYALKVAAEGAMVGNAKLEDTTSALGAAWKSLLLPAHDVGSVMATLNAIVGAGNMRMDELVTALGSGVLPVANQVGLKLPEVGAALAILKDEGFGAYGAMAQFSTALHFFTSPTDKATKAFKKLGLGQLDLADMMRKKGIIPTLELLHSRLKITGEELARSTKKKWSPETQQEKVLGEILPGGRGRVMRVLMNQIVNFQQKLDQITGTTKNFAEAVKTTQETAAAKIHTAWSNVQTDLVNLGDTFRDQGTSIITWGLGSLDSFVKGLTFVAKHIKTFIAVLAPLTAAWIAYKVAVMGAVFWTRLMIVFGWISFFFELASAIGVASAAMLLLDAVSLPMLVIPLIVAAIVAALVILAMHFGWVKTAGVNAWHWIKAAAIDAWHWMVQAGKDAIKWLLGAWATIKNSGVVKFFGRLIPGGGSHPKKGQTPSSFYQKQLKGGYTGGVVTAGGAINVGEHGRETIILPSGSIIQPASMRSMPGGSSAAGASPGGVYEFHLHNYLDGREVTEIVSKHMANKIARK